MPTLEGCLDALKGRLAQACARAGRPAESVRLVAVTKGVGLEAIRHAYRLGLRDFGENRPEEAVPKIEALADLPGVRWHMIGHIQSRKARQVAPAFALVHSVERMKIAAALEREAAQAGRRLPILLQVNLSGEASKQGWAALDAAGRAHFLAQARAIAALPHLELRGLMTMAPWTDDPETVRPVFQALAELRPMLAGLLPADGGELSMGMTDDFEVAVEEGATLVRIGRALFGERRQD